MKLNQALILLGVLIACLACSFVHSSEQDQNQPSQADVIVTGTRSGLAVPKLFDFERFKNVFKKKYSTIMEELARKKIFLGRAIRAFVSFLGYKHYKNDKYLKINELSDWTAEEHNRILNKLPLSGLKVTVVEDPKGDLEKTPVADMKDIEEKLAEISNHPDYGTELNKRKKRDVNEKRSSLTVDDLFGELKEGNDGIEHVPSNNPEYQTPELSSYGDEDEPQAPMEEETSSLIANLPGARYVGSLFSNLFGSTSGSSYRPTYPKSNLPDEVFVDHRKSGCFGPAKNQGQCGSCYVFSTVGLYEWQFCHETGKKVSFSEQYPLDCGERVGLAGCGGGLEVKVAQFFGTFGAELRGSYPYRQRSDICPYDRKTNSRRMGYIRLLTDDDGGMLGVKHPYVQKYLNSFPMAMGLGVSEDFSDYGGGVDHGETCKEDRGHSMVLVGSGREDGHEYWLFRNSYGPSWGLDGYYKLNKLAKNCLLDDGMGYFLKPKRGEQTIFDFKANAYNDPKYVNQRYYDVMHGKYIQKNPYNSGEDEPTDAEFIVTPPPSHHY